MKNTKTQKVITAVFGVSLLANGFVGLDLYNSHNEIKELEKQFEHATDRIYKLSDQKHKLSIELNAYMASNVELSAELEEKVEQAKKLEDSLAKEKANLSATKKELEKVKSENSTLKKESARTSSVKTASSPAKVSLPSRGESSTSAGKSISAEFTAYYPANDAMQGGGITATGHNLYNSITYQGMKIIAAPPHIPFYSIVQVNVPGYGSFKGIVLDRGGRIQGNKFDIALSNKSECISFGRRQGTVQILRWGK